MPWKNIEARRANGRKNYPAKYKRRRKEIITCVGRRRAGLREWFRQLTANTVCVYPGCASREGIEWHHRKPEEKFMAITTMVGSGYSKERILEEMRKCDPFCRDHHTDEHKGYFRGAKSQETPTAVVVFR